MIKIKNKKAEAGSPTIIPLIYIISGIVLLSIIAISLIYYDIPEKWGSWIPGFEKGEENDEIPLEQTQPSELRGLDKCINSDFYWADGFGNPVKTYETGEAYIFIHFPESAGDLLDLENPCGGYSLVIIERLGNKENLYSEYFESIVKSSKIWENQGKKYHIYPFEVEDPGLRKSGEYTFKIMKGDYLGKPTTNVRAGAKLIVEDKGWLR